MSIDQCGHEPDTVVGPLCLDEDREWYEPRILMVQFQGIKGKRLQAIQQGGNPSGAVSGIGNVSDSSPTNGMNFRCRLGLAALGRVPERVQAVEADLGQILAVLVRGGFDRPEAALELGVGAAQGGFRVDI